MTIPRLKYLLPVLNVAVVIGVGAHSRALAAHNHAELTSIPEWMALQWANAPAAIVQSLIGAVLERLPHGIQGRHTYSAIYDWSFLFCVAAVWYLVGSALDDKRPRANSRTQRKGLRILSHSLLVVAGVFIGYVGWQDIPARGFYTVTNWAVIHDALFASWSLALIIAGVWDLLPRRLTPTKGPAHDGHGCVTL